MARVAVDVPLANLDRPFDYEIPAPLADKAVAGARVRVRFAGRLRDGFILDVADTTEVVDLLPLHKVVSAEPVLHPEVARLIRAVADHYAGGFADVVRLAVPRRHGITENAAAVAHPPPNLAETAPGPLSGYPWGAGFVTALEARGRARAAWTVMPTPQAHGDWAAGFVEAARATLRAGRGALLLVPDQGALDLLTAACREVFGAGSFVTLSADLGPAARYRSFLAASRGHVRLVLGTRAAVFAPVADLGLVALWDDGNDTYAEPRAPYPHAREVAVLRAHLAGCGLLLAARSRTAEVHQLVERGWVAAIAATPAATRHESARVMATADHDTAIERDPMATVARVPHEVFAAVRAALASGPVLVQVPRAGYRPLLVCRTCRTLVRCPRCEQPMALPSPARSTPACRWCGPNLAGWRCPDCGDVHLRSPVVGVERTAEEWGKAFPGTRVVHSASDHLIDSVDDQPAIVLATPGAEPIARYGYAAGVLLDASLMLRRPELRAAEEALRRWLAVTALVRPGADGGTVVVVGDPAERAIQALVRLDPIGFAERELGDRKAAGFPPAQRLILMEGAESTLTAALALLSPGPEVEVIGPFEGSAEALEPLSRVTLRCSLAAGPALVAAVRTMQSLRSARKAEGTLRIRVDPQVVG